MSKYWRYIFGFLIVYAVFLRVYKLGETSFWIDEGFSSYSTTHWVNTRYYLHNISQLISFTVFGVSDWSARFPSVIFSLFTIPIVYFISEKLFQDKRISVMATLLFCFSTIEIAWARQARFYTLLQFLFYFNIYIAILLSEKFSWKLLFFAVLMIYASILFHPFLYVSIVILGGMIAYILYNRVGLKPQKYDISIGIVGLGSIVTHQIYKIFSQQSTLGITVQQKLPDASIQKYIDFYSGYILGQTGWLYILFMGALFIFAYKRSYIKSLIFSLGFLIAFYVISQKGILFHTRYVFFLFPLVYLGGVYTYFYLGDLLRNIYLKVFYFFSIGALVLLSFHSTIIPQSYYNLDFTAPQVNFKSAYMFIPDGENIVSGFPMMCKWYYAARGDCTYALAINYVGTPESSEIILNRGEDNYTNLLYLGSVDQLKKGVKYYFVLDSLSQKRFISQNLYKELLEYGEIIYNEETDYKNIQIITLNN